MGTGRGGGWVSTVLVTFLAAMTKFLTKSTCRREGLLWLAVQSSVVQKAWQQEQEAAGHMMSQ